MTRSKTAAFLISLALLPGCGDDSEGSDPVNCAPVGSIAKAVEVYGNAWNEPDETKRNCLLARSVSPLLVYVDPTTDTTTAPALSAAIGEFHRSSPGFSIAQLSGLQVRERELRFAWDFRTRDPQTQVEQSAVKGVDYIEVGEDNRLTNIRGYWEPLPTTPPEGSLADYVEAWTLADAAARDAKLGTALADSVRFTADGVDADGRQEIAAAIGELAATSVQVLGVQRYPKFARVVLELESAGGSEQVTDYLYLDGAGRITRAARFEGDLPPRAD
ncbi:MAG TPA: hypothetical protein VK524_29815 [Polyangiaceae bacterium]|nr:hypothetical protein [Polyangiaceae bacterium]